MDLLSGKVEIFLEQREVASYHPAKFAKIWILLSDKNATSLCSKIISTFIVNFLGAARSVV